MGAIVGDYTIHGSSANQGFELVNGAATPIAFPGSTSTIPTGINSSGEIIGEYTSASGIVSNFYFDGTTYVALPTPPGAAGCIPQHITNLGKIVLDCQKLAGGQASFPVYIGTPATSTEALPR